MKLAIILLALISLSSVTAQPVLPLGEGRLRAEAVQQAREVEVMLYADAVPSQGYDYRIWTGVKATPDISAQAQDLKPKLTTATPEDQVYSYIRVLNKDGDTLFWGWTSTKPVKVNDKWTLPESAGNFDLEFSGLPFTLEKNITSAELLVKNQYGYYDPTNIGFDGKKIFLTEGLESRDGIIRVTYTDGTTTWFSTVTGAAMPTMDFSPAISLGFPDLWSYKDPTEVVLTVTTVERRGTLPTIEVVMAVAGKVTFTVATSEGKRPKAYWFKKASSDADWDRIDILSPTVKSIDIPLLQGINYVVPEWSEDDFIPIESPAKG